MWVIGVFGMDGAGLVGFGGQYVVVGGKGRNGVMDGWMDGWTDGEELAGCQQREGKVAKGLVAILFMLGVCEVAVKCMFRAVRMGAGR